MKYLFFDIECSNCFNPYAKMCEYGYVLTDQNFNVITKNVFVMSPGNRRNRQNRFDKSIYKRDPEFQWAYPEDVYFESPEFPEFYDRIQKLMQDEDTMVFGFAINNDIKYLTDSTSRYNLKFINFNAYDIVEFMKYYSSKIEKISSLDKTYKKFADKKEIATIQPHLSRDDAFMTMRVLEAMCKNLNVTVQELIELCPSAKYNSYEFIRKKEIAEMQKALREENKHFWASKCFEYQKDDNENNGVAVSHKVFDDTNTMCKALQLIRSKNLKPVNKSDDSKYLLVIDEEDRKRILETFKRPYEGTICTFEEMLNM